MNQYFIFALYQVSKSPFGFRMGFDRRKRFRKSKESNPDSKGKGKGKGKALPPQDARHRLNEGSGRRDEPFNEAVSHNKHVAPHGQHDPRPSTSKRRARSPSPTQSSSGWRPDKYVRIEGTTPFQVVKVDTRRLPSFTKTDLDFLRNNLTVENETGANTRPMFDTKSVKEHGLLFFFVERDKVVFAANSGSIHEVQDHLLSFLRPLLNDPHIVKIGNWQHKRLIESIHKVTINGHLDPMMFVSRTNLKFVPALMSDPGEKMPEDFILLKATRKVKTLISAYWDFVLAKTIAKSFFVNANLSPWSRLVLAAYADVKGRYVTHLTPLTSQEIAAVLDASPYYWDGTPTLLVEPRSEIRTLATIGQNKTHSSTEKIVWRSGLLAKVNIDGCPYPLCREKIVVDSEATNHLLESCPLIESFCETCQHFGHELGAHIDHDQVILDNLFKTYAPSHINAGYVWQAVETKRADWESYLYGVAWQERHSLEVKLPKPRPPTEIENEIARARETSRLADEVANRLTLSMAKKETARNAALQVKADNDARAIKFAAQAAAAVSVEPPPPVRPPGMSDNDYLALLENGRIVRRRILELEKEAIAAANTERLKGNIQPLPFHPQELAANFIAAVLRNPVPPGTTFAEASVAPKIVPAPSPPIPPTAASVIPSPSTTPATANVAPNPPVVVPAPIVTEPDPNEALMLDETQQFVPDYEGEEDDQMDDKA